MSKKKQHRDAVYRLYVDLTQSVKQAFRGASDKEIESAIGGYMALMKPPEDAEEITLKPDEVKQTALLAAQALTRHLYERVK